MLSEKVDSKNHRTDVLCYFPPRERRKNAGRARTATQSKHVRGGANAAGQFLGKPRPILRVAQRSGTGRVDSKKQSRYS